MLLPFYFIWSDIGSKSGDSQTGTRPSIDDVAEPSLPGPSDIANDANFILGLRFIYSTLGFFTFNHYSNLKIV